MTDSAAAAPDLDLGLIVRETLGVTRRNLGPFVLISLLLGGLPDALIEAARVGLPALGDVGWNAIGRVLSLFTGIIVQGAVTSVSLADLEGRSMSVFEGARIGLRRFGSLFGVNFLSGLGVLVGLLLLIIPGLLLAARWAVITPVVLTEGRSWDAALKRSQDLTKGLLWRIVVLLLLLVAAILAVNFSLAFLAGLLGSFLGGFTANILATVVVSTAIGVMISPGAAVLYVQLRRLREGAIPNELAAVFD